DVVRAESADQLRAKREGRLPHGRASLLRGTQRRRSVDRQLRGRGRWNQGRGPGGGLGGRPGGGQGDGCGCNAPLPVNPNVVGNLATRPHTVTSWQPSAPGGM